MENLEKLLTDRDLEAFTGRSRSCWQKDRLRGGPDALPFVRVGRLIRYRKADVLIWLDRHVVRSTSEQSRVS